MILATRDWHGHGDEICDHVWMAAQATRPYDEAQLDLCVATLAQVSAGLADYLWGEAGLAPRDEFTVVLQGVRTGDRRTSDVVLIGADRQQLHIENKKIGGSFQDGQAEGYRLERGEYGAGTLLIAPERVLDSMGSRLDDFSGSVSTEMLAVKARNVAPESARESQLLASWAAWLDEYSAQAGYVGRDHDQPDWVDWYRNFVVQASDGVLALEAGTMMNGQASFAEFANERPVVAPLSMTHKITFGSLDIRAPGWTESALSRHIEGLAEPLPDGWEVGRPRQGRISKLTGEPTPVIRACVPELMQPFPSTADSEPAVREMVQRGIEIADWLAKIGPEGLVPPNQS